MAAFGDMSENLTPPTAPHSGGSAHKACSPDLLDEIASLSPWFHNLHLPGGIQTAPDHFLGDFPAYKWQELADALPRNLTGWSVLDIGCNAGFYSFELARRGAAVTGIDANAHYLTQARWAAEKYGLAGRVRFEKMQVYDLANHDQTYDLVLFLGVFYHLRYPLLGLDIVSRRVRRLMVFQTLTMPGEAVYPDIGDHEIGERKVFLEEGWPKMAFIEYRFSNDPTNWWAANHAAVEAMLRSSGMKVISRPGTEVYLCAPDPEAPSCVTTWNAEEFRAATGQKPVS